MARLSLYRPTKGNDYKFFDRRISEMFTIGGTHVNIHKYLGPVTDVDSSDATQPKYTNQSEKNIQDLLFLENRDRKYDQQVHTLRGVYSVADVDFDLSQFGLFLANDTIFISFHYNDMIGVLDRKIIAGDVIELPHLTDYHPLDADIPTALKRYYVVQDASRASEGYSPTWYNHIWRCKCTPLVDSQEYKDILGKVKQDELAGNNNPIGELLSVYNKTLEMASAVEAQAIAEVPKSGYDVSSFYVPKPDASGNVAADAQRLAITTGYLTGDGVAPNGAEVLSAVSFPPDAKENDYVLRLDFFPHRLFRFTGKKWTKVEDELRTSLTPGAQNTSKKSGFINNDSEFTTKSGTVVSSRQNLNAALRPVADL
ncbi:hypothetical protein UFOVP116_22 [uncultured Caudovirales phage]|uniref:Uncharacterized protein n=1 Tax=uncultured Caudovirales phage TaxID=2100421 RepID=A0A6J5L9I5_9CAUD|nr:hypothetical protein UFOVP116_22 [uncultured Caudovirales phage]